MVLPRTNPTKSFWIEGAQSPLRDHRTTESLPGSCDVLIIGSGYSGTTIAYWLSKPPSMVMLEARDVCGGATGRNGGQLKPHFYIPYPKWSELYGRKVAMDLIRHECSHLQAFQNLVDEEKIDCSLRISRAWDTLMSDVEIKRSFDAYDELLANEGEEAVKEIQDIIRDPREAEERTRIRGAQAALTCPAGQM
ncbi:hypothetical protein P7C73_g463, partial [Tremellales sp. Uapishka_1]